MNFALSGWLGTQILKHIKELTINALKLAMNDVCLEFFQFHCHLYQSAHALFELVN